MTETRTLAEKAEMEVHFPWNTDPDFEGQAALCDHEAGLEETPRQRTLSSSIRTEVTCKDCLGIMKHS